MPVTNLKLIETGARSSLYASLDGALYRNYHDTNHWDGPLPVLLDAQGRQRYSGNRSVSSLLDDGFDFRGTKKKRIPPYLKEAKNQLSKHPGNIEEFAALCGGIAISTAWNYVSSVIEHWPHHHIDARSFVHASLCDALDDLEDTSGPLRDVMARLDAGPLHFDLGWKHLENRFAHLRLARLCCEAAAA